MLLRSSETGKSTGATLAAFTPACIGVALRPTTQTLLTSLAVSSLAFFLFSFQVHEKGVLVVLLPLTALFCDTQHRWLAMHVTAVAMFRYEHAHKSTQQWHMPLESARGNSCSNEMKEGASKC